MSDPRSLLERESRRLIQPDGAFERLVRRRDRRRRNQRIAAGVVGIAVFVAALWIVMSGLSLDRSEKSAAPAGEVTGPAETEPIKCPGCEAGPVRPKTAPIGTVTRSGAECALKIDAHPIPSGLDRLTVVNKTNRVTAFDLFYLEPDVLTFARFEEIVLRGGAYPAASFGPDWRGASFLTTREVGADASGTIEDYLTSGGTYAVVCAHPFDGIDIFRAGGRRPFALVGPLVVP